MHRVKQQSHIYIYIYIVLALNFTLFSSLILSSHLVSADTTTSPASVVIPASYCNVSTGSSTGLGSSNTTDTPHVATINNGTYKEDIGITTFKVVCGDNGGYSIYAIGYSNNEYGNNKLLATVGNTLSPSFDILTGTALSGNVSNWAMKLIPMPSTFTPTIESDSNGSFSNYHIVPSTYTKVATFPSVTDDFQGSSFKSTYRAYVSPTQPAGSYVGRVRYTMVHPSSAIPNQPMTTEAGKIGYYPNANGFVVDTMGDQEYTGYTSTVGNLVTPLTPGGEATLWASNFKRPGYGFVGWSDTYDYVANVGSATNPNAKIYGPNETITTPSNLNEEGLSLYAVWVESAGTIQNWSCPNNTTMPIGTVTALTDLRDNNTYAVAKLKDGKCWMIENLRLGGNNPITLTPNDSDVYSNFTLNSSVEPILANWCITLDAICTNQSLLNADNSLNPVSITTTPDAPILSYGNYYNWYSATAGTGTYSAATNNTQVSSSVCPKGWKLPAGGKGANVNTNDYRKMSVAVTGMEPGSNSEYNGDMGIKAISILRSYPNNFVFSGMIEVVPAEQRRSATGHYWTSTVYSLERAAYLFDYNYVLVRPSNAADKFMGFTIRCLAN